LFAHFAMTNSASTIASPRGSAIKMAQTSSETVKASPAIGFFFSHARKCSVVSKGRLPLPMM
jgi:hypothetical protein